jgi:hypothetical protein
MNLSTTTFTDCAGNPVADGYLTLSLDEDAVAPNGTQLSGDFMITINLDDTGTPIDVPTLWPSFELQSRVTQPNSTGVLYKLRVYTSKGLLVYNQSVNIQ